MGTRGLTIVRQGGEARVAQYGQWDHYAAGQGLNALLLLREPGFVDALRTNVALVREYTLDEVRDIWREAGANDSGWVTFDIADKVEKLYPELSRNTGSQILWLIAEGKVTTVSLDLAFREALDCEGVAEVDLDKNTYAWEEYGRRGEFPLDDLPSEEEFLAFFGESGA